MADLDDAPRRASWRRRPSGRPGRRFARGRADKPADPPEAEELDELLLALVDDGLLQTDLAPPLIGPPPARHLRDRLVALGRDADARLIDDAQVAFEAGDLARRARLSGRRSPAGPSATCTRC